MFLRNTICMTHAFCLAEQTRSHALDGGGSSLHPTTSCARYPVTTFTGQLLHHYASDCWTALIHQWERMGPRGTMRMGRVAICSASRISSCGWVSHEGQRCGPHVPQSLLVSGACVLGAANWGLPHWDRCGGHREMGFNLCSTLVLPWWRRLPDAPLTLSTCRGLP